MMRGIQLHSSATVAAEVIGGSLGVQPGGDTLLPDLGVPVASTTVNKIIPVDYLSLLSAQNQSTLQQKLQQQQQQQALLSSQQMTTPSMWNDDATVRSSILTHPSFRYSDLWGNLNSSAVPDASGSSAFAVAQQQAPMRLDSGFQTGTHPTPANALLALQALSTSTVTQAPWQEFVDIVSQPPIFLAQQEFLFTQAFNVTAHPTVDAALLGTYHLQQNFPIGPFPLDYVLTESAPRLDSMPMYTRQETLGAAAPLHCYVDPRTGLPFGASAVPKDEAGLAKDASELMAEDSPMVNLCVQSPVASH